MKTVKNVVTRGFLIMVLTLMAMTAIDMVGNGAVFGAKVANASSGSHYSKAGTPAKDGKMKIPKNAKKAEKKAAKKLNKLAYIFTYTWKKGRLVQLGLSADMNKKIKPSHLKAFTGLTDLYIRFSSSAWKNANFSKYKNLKTLVLYDSNNKGCLKKLDLSKNKKLTALGIDRAPQLNKLNLSKNKKLKKLYMGNLSINKIDLSKNRKLKELSMYYTTKISSLSLNGLSSLEEIYLSNCDALKKCSVENCNKLTLMTICDVKQLTKITVKNCPNLPPQYPTFENHTGIMLMSPSPFPILSYNNKVYNFVDDEWKLQN